MLALPQQAIHRVHRGLHDLFHLFVRDVRKLDTAVADGADLSRMQVFDGTIAEG